MIDNMKASSGKSCAINYATKRSYNGVLINNLAYMMSPSA